MSTQLRRDLKSIAPTSVSRSAMNPFGAKDLTALAATLSPVAEVREDLAEYVRAAPLATGRRPSCYRPNSDRGR